MRYVVPVVLLLVAIIHALPVVGVLGVPRLSQLYGVAVNEPNMEVLLRHRSVLFGILSALLGYAAIRPELHRVGLVAGFVSVGSFLVVAQSVGSYNAALATVFKVDLVALALLVVGLVAHVARRG
jgi:hypothetical protein